MFTRAVEVNGWPYVQLWSDSRGPSQWRSRGSSHARRLWGGGRGWCSCTGRPGGRRGTASSAQAALPPRAPAAWNTGCGARPLPGGAAWRARARRRVGGSTPPHVTRVAASGRPTREPPAVLQPVVYRTHRLTVEYLMSTVFKQRFNLSVWVNIFFLIHVYHSVKMKLIITCLVLKYPNDTLRTLLQQYNKAITTTKYYAVWICSHFLYTSEQNE